VGDHTARLGCTLMVRTANGRQLSLIQAGAKERSREAVLDEALKKTFPASDPVTLRALRSRRRAPNYKRHGTTTLFAALNVLEGTALGRCMQRPRGQARVKDRALLRD
jgi:hypothetical protein